MTSKVFSEMWRRQGRSVPCCNCALHIEWLNKIVPSTELSTAEKKEMTNEVLSQAKKCILSPIFANEENLQRPLQDVYREFIDALEEETQYSEVSESECCLCEAKEKAIQELEASLAATKRTQKEHEVSLNGHKHCIRTIPDILLNFFNARDKVVRRMSIPIFAPHSGDEQNFFHDCIQDICKTVDTQVQLVLQSNNEYHAKNHLDAEIKNCREMSGLKVQIQELQKELEDTRKASQSHDDDLKLRKYKRIMAKLAKENEELRKILSLNQKKTSQMSLDEAADCLNTALERGDAEIVVKTKDQPAELRGQKSNLKKLTL